MLINDPAGSGTASTLRNVISAWEARTRTTRPAWQALPFVLFVPFVGPSSLTSTLYPLTSSFVPFVVQILHPQNTKYRWLTRMALT